MQDTRGRYSATDAKVIADQSQSQEGSESSTSVSQSNQKKICTMVVAKSNKDVEEAFACVKVQTQIKWKLQE